MIETESIWARFISWMWDSFSHSIIFFEFRGIIGAKTRMLLLFLVHLIIVTVVTIKLLLWKWMMAWIIVCKRDYFDTRLALWMILFYFLLTLFLVFNLNLLLGKASRWSPVVFQIILYDDEEDEIWPTMTWHRVSDRRVYIVNMGRRGVRSYSQSILVFVDISFILMPAVLIPFLIMFVSCCCPYKSRALLV